jgi:hypothetical protein
VRCNGNRQGKGAGTELAAAAADPEKAQEKPLRPRQCHKYMQKELAAKFETILAGFVDEACKGGCAHMKLVVELLEPRAEDTNRKGSAQRLLEELGE